MNIVFFAVNFATVRKEYIVLRREFSPLVLKEYVLRPLLIFAPRGGGVIVEERPAHLVGVTHAARQGGRLGAASIPSTGRLRRALTLKSTHTRGGFKCHRELKWRKARKSGDNFFELHPHR